MSQTDEIHESFYDLFNQRFRSIEDPKHGTRFYTNIAIGAHSKPCRVDPKFQCVVVVRESDINKTPAPFLNRFEKYRLTHKELFWTVQQSLPPCLHILLNMVSVMVSIFCCGVCLYIYTMLILNLMPLTSGNRTPGSRFYSDLLDTSVCIYQFVLKRCLSARLLA